ncbi:hypothetical protein HHK36_021927 [Tetracentron sinense]|uniref:SHSP domain-containing protein n=1 Tax=Tetracentron sinense TaxID=13715 RepID=A0A834YT20_TETSI|nr:hypothetical protein HHK36_021927 [Tetracentron sinense]
MSPVADSTAFNGNLASAVDRLLLFPESIGKLLLPFPLRSNDADAHESKGTTTTSIPVDILDTPEEFIFFMDVPGLSKSDILVTVEDENTLVIRSNRKRKREDGEEEGCKYIRLERKTFPKFLRKFQLPENSNVSAISAKCENGVLTVMVEKLPPPPKAKTVQVSIS